MKKLHKIVDACAPTAIRNASDLTDEKVAEIFLSQGFLDEDWKIAAKQAGLRLRLAHDGKIILKRFIKRFGKGTYIVSTWNHLFVVRDGEVIDPTWENSGLYRTVTHAWKIFKN